MILSFSRSASVPKGALATVPSILPDLIAAMRAGSSPICSIVASLHRVDAHPLEHCAHPKSAEEPNRLTPNFLPLSCSILLISGRVMS